VDPPLVGVVLGQMLGAAVAVGLGAFGLRRSFELRLDKARLGELLHFSLPLVPASVGLFLSVYVSRLILNGLASLDDVGVYTLAAQIGGIATLGIVGVQSAVTPLVMAHHQDPKTPAQLARLFELFVGFGIVASLTLGLFAAEFIYFLGNSEYGIAGPLVLLLAPAALLSQMYFFAPGFAVSKRTKLQMWVSLASAAIAVGANFALISLWGIVGAAFATLASAAAFLTLWFVASQRLYPIPVRWLPVALAVAGAIGLGWASLAAPDMGLAAGLVIKAGLLAAAIVLVLVTGLVPLRSGFALLRTVALPLRQRPSVNRR
jgi:O-antigen/teichoic acid export membrane protein